MLITYSNEEETIVCTKDSEQEMIKRYFNEDNRNIEKYMRDEYIDEMLAITSQLYCY